MNLENIIFIYNLKLNPYARYDDDIFVDVKSEEELIKLREKIVETSELVI